jgi:hypothetical protein
MTTLSNCRCGGTAVPDVVCGQHYITCSKCDMTIQKATAAEAEVVWNAVMNRLPCPLQRLVEWREEAVCRRYTINSEAGVSGVNVRLMSPALYVGAIERAESPEPFVEYCNYGQKVIRVAVTADPNEKVAIEQIIDRALRTWEQVSAEL